MGKNGVVYVVTGLIDGRKSVYVSLVMACEAMGVPVQTVRNRFVSGDSYERGGWRIDRSLYFGDVNKRRVSNYGKKRVI